MIRLANCTMSVSSPEFESRHEYFFVATERAKVQGGEIWPHFEVLSRGMKQCRRDCVHLRCLAPSVEIEELATLLRLLDQSELQYELSNVKPSTGALE